MELKKKIFFINEKFILIEEFVSVFIKIYNPIDKMKAYFKTKNELELIIINESVKNKLSES